MHRTVCNRHTKPLPVASSGDWDLVREGTTALFLTFYSKHIDYFNIFKVAIKETNDKSVQTIKSQEGFFLSIRFEVIQVWGRIKSPVMTEENISARKENTKRTWIPTPCYKNLPKGHIMAVFTHRREWGSQSVPRVLSACPLWDEVARISCCFHSILYILPAFLYLFFVCFSYSFFSFLLHSCPSCHSKASFCILGLYSEFQIHNSS